MVESFFLIAYCNVEHFDMLCFCCTTHFHIFLFFLLFFAFQNERPVSSHQPVKERWVPLYILLCSSHYSQFLRVLVASRLQS
uniref:Uncharacterized protein n=1 Tax=Anguilla anguilla TaxID=7936 RepID=A0A0E9WX15_ANGAN